MNGLSQTFEFQGKTYELKRPAFGEMEGYVDRVGFGEVESVLVDAAGERGEEMKADIAAAEFADTGKLWNGYTAFLGFEAYLKNFYAPHQARLNQHQAVVNQALEMREKKS